MTSRKVRGQNERENSRWTKTQSTMRAVTLVFLPLLLATILAEDELGQLLGIARERMLCAAEVKCLETNEVQRLVRAKDLKSIDLEDLAIVLAHHFLHGDSSCTAKISHFKILEDEVMRAIETEDIPGILRTFKKILKDGKTECVGAETVLQEMPPSSPTFSPMQWVRSVLAILMAHVLKGHCIEDGTPSRDSLDDLFNRYGDTCSPYMTVKGLRKMMDDLESAGNMDDHNHHHSHGHHHHGDHNHLHECDHNTMHHDHSSHYHNDHDHKDHDHSSHDHHDHSNHDHKGHDHSNHDHKGHDHSDYDHKSNDLSYHNNSGHEQTNHDKTDHNHSHHESSSQDQTNHDHHDHSHLDNSSQIPHNYSYLDDSNHYHSDHSIHNHSYHVDFNQSNENQSNFNVTDPDLKTSNNSQHDQSNEEASLINYPNNNSRNYSEPIVHESKMIEKNPEPLISTVENTSHVLENVLPPLLSNLWRPIPLASENSNFVDETPSSVPYSSTMTTQCMSAESLVSRFGSDRISVSKAEFLRLCPSLVQQTVGDACEDPSVMTLQPSKLEVYGYGSVCVFVLCLASLSGVLLLPLMRRNARHYVIAGFQGLAFSTLASDALLHLLPECLGLHSHDHSHGHSHEVFPEPYAQLMLGFLATTYALFMTEAVLCALSGRSHDQSGRGHTHVHHISEPTLISIKSKSSSQLPISGDQSCSSLDTEIVEMDITKKPPNLMVSQPVICGLTSVALVVTLGDALHNFGDGLAIGAAFSANIRGGLSTTAAAFCHELPHELGDFVVLLSTGLSFSRALWLNFLSGLTCFAGLYVGILVGDNEVARKWVMAVTASTFLYVALAEMVPELREHRHGSPFKMLLVKNVGIIAGVVIMCVISIYEHEMA